MDPETDTNRLFSVDRWVRLPVVNVLENSTKFIIFILSLGGVHTYSKHVVKTTPKEKSKKIT